MFFDLDEEKGQELDTVQPVVLALSTSETVEIAVAVASGLVALATFFLGWKTRAMARETKRVAEATELEAREVAAQATSTAHQAQISAAALRAAVRPWLTFGWEDPPNVRVAIGSPHSLVVQARIRNVGSGIAVIEPEACLIRGGGVQPGTTVERTGHAERPVLPPNEETWITFQVAGPDIEERAFQGKPASHGDPAASYGQLMLSVVYSDTEQMTGMRADISLVATDSAGSEWIFNELEYVSAPGAPEEEGVVKVKLPPRPKP